MTSQLVDRRKLPIFIHSSIDDMGLTPNAFRVYAHLARRATKDGDAWPSYQSIGDHCFGAMYSHPDTRRRHAVAAVKELISHGLIAKEKRTADGWKKSNSYVLVDVVTLQSQQVVTPQSQQVVTLQSQQVVTPQSQQVVTPQSHKDTPVEDAPVESTPNSAAAAPETEKPASVDGVDAGRFTLQLLDDTGHIFIFDPHSKRQAATLEERYTLDDIRAACAEMVTKHEAYIQRGEHGITKPLGYMETILVRKAKPKPAPRQQKTVRIYNQYTGQVEEVMA